MLCQHSLRASLNHKIELAILQEEAQPDHLAGLLDRSTFASKLSALCEKMRLENKELASRFMEAK